jgi:small subunit ribosomal protein S4
LARYRESVCRFCRREGLKLYLKGERCFSDKCAVDRRNYPPGQHGQGRIKRSDYGLQLREKQKVRHIYGLVEKQFHHAFERAERMRGITGVNMLLLLERRLDNMVYRIGFATSRNSARQMVSHRHFLVNGRIVDIPSYLVSPGDVIEVREKSRKIPGVQNALDSVDNRGGVPRWLEMDRENFRAVVKELPSREDLTMPIQEQLVVEYYSR